MRELWQEASGIEDNPSVLLVDPQGILQADSPDKLEERIAKLLTPGTKQSPAKPKP